MPNDILELPAREPQPARVDRRKCGRFRPEWPAALEGRDIADLPFIEEAVLINLSAQGACVSLKAQVLDGASVRISIRLPAFDSTWMQYDARVVRVDREAFRVALKFEHLKPRFLKNMTRPGLDEPE